MGSIPTISTNMIRKNSMKKLRPINEATFGDVKSGKGFAKISNDYIENKDEQGIYLSTKCRKIICGAEEFFKSIYPVKNIKLRNTIVNLYLKHKHIKTLRELQSKTYKDYGEKYNNLFSHACNIIVTRRRMMAKGERNLEGNWKERKKIKKIL